MPDSASVKEPVQRDVNVLTFAIGLKCTMLHVQSQHNAFQHKAFCPQIYASRAAFFLLRFSAPHRLFFFFLPGLPAGLRVAATTSVLACEEALLALEELLSLPEGLLVWLEPSCISPSVPSV